MSDDKTIVPGDLVIKTMGCDFELVETREHGLGLVLTRRSLPFHDGHVIEVLWSGPNPLQLIMVEYVHVVKPI